MVPKTILWFTDSLGQTEFRKAVVLIAYYGEGIQIKISKGKGCIGENRGGTNVCFRASALGYSGAVWTVLNSAVICDNMESIANQGSLSEL